MLAGAAAGLHHVAGFPGKETLKYRPDRLVIAMECRRVEAAVSKGTVFHGTRSQLLAAAKALINAVAEADAVDAQTAQ